MKISKFMQVAHRFARKSFVWRQMMDIQMGRHDQGQLSEVPVAWRHYEGIDDSCHEWWINNETMPVVTIEGLGNRPPVRVPCEWQEAINCPDALDGKVYVPLRFVSTEPTRTLVLAENPFKGLAKCYKAHETSTQCVKGLVLDMEGLWHPSEMRMDLVRTYTPFEEAEGYMLGVRAVNISSVEHVPVVEVLAALSQSSSGIAFRPAGMLVVPR